MKAGAEWQNDGGRRGLGPAAVWTPLASLRGVSRLQHVSKRPGADLGEPVIWASL